MTTPVRQQNAPLPATTITPPPDVEVSGNGRHRTQVLVERGARSGTEAAGGPEAGGPKAGNGRRPVYNRIRTLMIHAPRYSFQGQARLAADAGVSRSTISRLLSGRINPSFRLAQAVTVSLEKHLKRPLDPREVLSPDGTYPTASGCEIASCRGCMPEEAYDSHGTLKPEYRDVRPGDWSLSRPSQTNPINPGKETK